MVRLEAGSRLGPYEIASLLDAGGMGEVYRARDTRLGRDVAIKVLAGYDPAPPDRLARFDREARAAASLNHPNIVTVYDVGAADGVPYIVSELLEGGTLREAIEPARPMVPRRAIEIASQVARGLAAAHARGIVHRDLKPENVFVCRDGAVKVLDFGLVRLGEAALAGAENATLSITAEHAVVGTPGYMAPEQVRGQEIDHRADIFALGVVLYEMLAGRRPFSGETRVDVMTSILTADAPDLMASGVPVPPALARTVLRCLEKNRDARFQSASDLAFALESMSGSSGALPPPPAAAHGWRRWILPVAAAGLAAALVVALQRDRPPAPLDRALTVQRLTEFEGIEEFPALSPDGKSVAFTAYVEGVRQVFVRLVAGGAPLQLTTAAVDHAFPRWTPDSSAVVFFTPAARGARQGALWEVAALGGAPRRLAESISGADVSRPDGRLAFFRLVAAEVELATAAADGSRAEGIRRLPAGSYYWHPRWSPDGRSIAYQKGDGVRFDLFAVPAAGGEPRPLTTDSSLIDGLTWRADGRALVYSSSRGSSIPYLPALSLWEVPVEGGAPAAVLRDEASYVHPDLHPDGVLVVSRMLRKVNIWRFDAEAARAGGDGAPVQITHQTGTVHTPTVSPDGTELAFLSDSGGHSNLWILNVRSGEARQVTQERDRDVAIGVPIWAPDGRSIAFVSSRGHSGLVFGIWLVDPDGSNLRQLVPRGLGATWSPDGRWVYYVERANDVIRRAPVDGGPAAIARAEPARNVVGIHGSTLYFLVERALVDGSPEFEVRAAELGGGPSRVVARLPASRLATWQVVNPALSPDGRWLAQALTDRPTTNVWVASTTSGEWQPLTRFAGRATYIARRVTWSPDGRYVFAAVGEGDADIIRLEPPAAQARSR